MPRKPKHVTIFGVGVFKPCTDLDGEPYKTIEYPDALFSNSELEGF